MDREKIKIGKTYDYATPSATGRFKVSDIALNGNSWWVVGFDKEKKKDIKVRAGQVFVAAK